MIVKFAVTASHYFHNIGSGDVTERIAQVSNTYSVFFRYLLCSICRVYIFTHSPSFLRSASFPASSDIPLLFCPSVNSPRSPRLGRILTYLKFVTPCVLAHRHKVILKFRAFFVHQQPHSSLLSPSAVPFAPRTLSFVHAVSYQPSSNSGQLLT